MSLRFTCWKALGPPRRNWEEDEVQLLFFFSTICVILKSKSRSGLEFFHAPARVTLSGNLSKMEKFVITLAWHHLTTSIYLHLDRRYWISPVLI